jgi:WD40 repeat protein
MRLLQNTQTRPVIGVGFGPDGKTLVAGGSGGFDVWDLPAGHTFVAVPESRDVFAFALDPLGRWFYFSEYQGGCSLYDLTSGEARRFPGDDHHVISVAAAPDGRRVAISRGGVGNNRLECWAIARGGRLRLAWHVPAPSELTSFPGLGFESLAFHPGGETVAALEQRPGPTPRRPRRLLVLRDAAGGAEQAASGFDVEPSPLFFRTAFTPDGQRLLTWDPQQFTFWDPASGAQVGRGRGPGRANLNGLAVHPSGRFFLTAAGDGHARYWDARTLKQTRALHWKIGKLYSVAFSRDGMLAAAGGDKGQVVVWDVDC